MLSIIMVGNCIQVISLYHIKFDGKSHWVGSNILLIRREIGLINQPRSFQGHISLDNVVLEKGKLFVKKN